MKLVNAPQRPLAPPLNAAWIWCPNMTTAAPVAQSFDLAQREVALARIRTMLADEDAPEEQRKADLRTLLAGLTEPFSPAAADTVGRTVTNIGVALSQGVVPHELHHKVISMLIDWLENEKGLEPIWRSHIALRLGASVFMGRTDPAHCDLIARHLVRYASNAVYEDDLLEHSVELLFTATWETTILDETYIQTLCSTVFEHMNADSLSITMRGRMLHAAACTLAKKQLPLALAEELIVYLLDAIPVLKDANSPHFSMLAWALSDAAARDLAKNVPLAALEILSHDDTIDDEFRDQIRKNVSIVHIMLAMQNMTNQPPENSPFLDSMDIDERLIEGLM
jgi:hypothetical protein